MKWSLYAVATGLFLAGSAVRADEKQAEPPSYTKDIKPFLATHCVECHNATKAKAGFNFDGFDALMKGSRKGKAIVAGEPDKSLAVRTLTGKGKRMPPSKYKNQPKAEEIDMLKAWIAAGAKDDSEKGDEKKGAQSETAPAALSCLVRLVEVLTDESASALEAYHHE
jgi:mono/diheme cytochrome c family protein